MPIDLYRVVFLYLSDLPMRCFPYPENIDDFLRSPIPADEHPSTYPKQYNPDQEEWDPYKSGDNTGGEPCPNQTENPSENTQDTSSDRRPVGR